MWLAGVQLTSPIRPPRPAHARELARDDLVARRELDAERGQHAVEARVLERQVLGVALDPVDDHVARCGARGARRRTAPG